MTIRRRIVMIMRISTITKIVFLTSFLFKNIDGFSVTNYDNHKAIMIMTIAKIYCHVRPLHFLFLPSFSEHIEVLSDIN